MNNQGGWAKNLRPFDVGIIIVLLFFSVPPIAVLFLPDFNPLGEYPPQTVLGDVRDAEGLVVVRAGGVVRVLGEKCSRVAYDVAVTGRVYFASRDERRLVWHRDGAGVRSPGCFTTVYVSTLPPGVTAGVWRLEGVEETNVGNRVQSKPIVSDWFRVEE